MIREIVCFYILFTVWVLSSACANPMSSDDLWQYTNIQTTSTSGIHPESDPDGMFGEINGSIEPKNTVFQDAQPINFIHWIEWTLNAPTTVSSFNLVAAHDSLSTMNHRGFSRFVLEAYVGTQWETVYEYDVQPQTVEGTYPVYGGGANYTAQNFLEIYDTFTPTTAQTWKISVTQFSDPNIYLPNGPRILELDGFNIIPEPATMILLTISGLGLFIKRIRK